MNSRWIVKRTLVPQPDGQRRWDYAYQYLVYWACGQEATQPLTSTSYQEVSDGNRLVCAGLDQPSATRPDH